MKAALEVGPVPTKVGADVVPAGGLGLPATLGAYIRVQVATPAGLTIVFLDQQTAAQFIQRLDECLYTARTGLVLAPPVTS